MKYIKYSLVVILMVFSFYISDKAIMIVEEMNPIMKKVKSLDIEKIEPVNAIINENTIVPGINGKKLNERESYLKMNEFGTFNETFLVFDSIKPKVSLYDNLDKIIIDTNKKNEVALIIESEEHKNILKEENIKYTKIIKDKKEIKDDIEYINGNLDQQQFYKLNTYLKKNKINNKICLVEKSNMNICQEFKYFLVKPSITINHYNLAEEIRKIKEGNIIYLDESLSKSELKIIIHEIKYKNLEIIYLKDLIKE